MRKTAFTLIQKSEDLRFDARRLIGASCFALMAACSQPSNEEATVSVDETTESASLDAKIELGSEVYATHCAACHGRNLEGALGTALVKSDWLYGRDSFSIDLNIQNGIPTAGMPAFGDILDEAESEGLLEFILAAQTGPVGEANPIPDELATEDYTLRVERLVEDGLENPWGIEFIDDGRALITENSGQLFWLIDDVLDPRPIVGIPEVDLATSTGGLLDVAIDPAFADNGWIYLAYSKSADPSTVEAPGMTEILRARISDYALEDTQIIYSVPEELHRPNSKHWGGRMLFGQDGYLYFSIGDMSQPDESQDPAYPTGKIHRIATDGSIPQDNPFIDQGAIAATVYSLGNRNVQGIAQHPITGDIWATEHGPHGGDELNVIENGANYGWPVTTYGVNYDGTVISDLTEKEGIEPPVTQWTPALAISANSFVESELFSKWRNNLLVGSLSREALLRLELDGRSVSRESIVFKDYGRIRDVKFAPDGSLYVLLNNPGMVVRITPEEPE